MKYNHSIIMLLGLTTSTLVALEPPQKVEPLAPNAETTTEEKVPAEAEPAKEKKVEAMPQVNAATSYMGIGSEEVPKALAAHLGLEEGTSILVRIVDPEGPAAKAGIQESDILTLVDGAKVKCHSCLCDILQKHKPGDSIAVKIIHRGVAQEKTLTLGAKPAESVAGIEDCAPDNAALPKELLDVLPKDQADRLRKAIEKNLQAMGGAAGGVQVIPMDGGNPGAPIPGVADLQKRVEKMLKLQIQGGQGGAGLNVIPGGGNMQMQMQSSVSMMDDQGRVEISKSGDSTEAKVYDNDGNLQWSGSYETNQDKAAVPAPIRERLEKLNIDTSVKGGGIQLKLNNGPKEPEPLKEEPKEDKEEK
jgi:hypothetical protein